MTETDRTIKGTADGPGNPTPPPAIRPVNQAGNQPSGLPRLRWRLPVTLTVVLAAVLALAVLTPWRDTEAVAASFWPAAEPTGAEAQRDGRPVELGLRFAVTTPGSVTAIRFYNGVGGDPGPRTASIWDSDGSLRARVRLPGSIGQGWQQFRLENPLQLATGHEYTVSYHTVTGAYMAATDYFTGRPLRSGPLYAPADGNGVFRYGESGFPTQSFQHSNYLVDVVFSYRPGQASAPPPATARPSAGPSTPPGGTGPQLPAITGDVGPGYYAKWRYGPPPDPGHLPIAVWLQDPRRLRDGRANALNYRDIGINTFTGLHGWPPDAGHLDAVAAAGLTVLGGVPDGGLGPLGPVRAHPKAAALRGYLLFDEPDMNQADGSVTGKGCLPPATLLRRAAELRKADPDRPVYVNFGKGMADPNYQAPKCDNSAPNLVAYAKACDICSVDIYPIADPYEPPERKGVYTVGLAVDRLRRATSGTKPVWGIIETSRIFPDGAKASPAVVRQLVWMQLIHGARGIGYFAHEFRRDGLTEDALLADRAMAAAVRNINRQIRELAAVLNAPTIDGQLTVTTTTPPGNTPAGVDTLVRRHGGATYVFAIGAGSAATPHGGYAKASFRLHGAGSGAENGNPENGNPENGPAENGPAENGTVEVIGEGRTLPVSGGAFTDDFTPYQVHLYKITP